MYYSGNLDFGQWSGYNFRAMMNKNTAQELLSDEKRLAKELPEVLALQNCCQLGPHHLEGDVLTHTRGVVEHLPAEAGPELVWAAILHDIAKPAARIEQERDGEIVTRFFKHEVIGMDMADSITKRAGLSQASREKVVWLVGNHMRIFILPAMGEEKSREFVSHPYFPELKTLFAADLAASRPRDEEWGEKKKELIKTIEEKIKNIKNRP